MLAQWCLSIEVIDTAVGKREEIYRDTPLSGGTQLLIHLKATRGDDAISPICNPSGISAGTLIKRCHQTLQQNYLLHKRLSQSEIANCACHDWPGI